MTGYSRIWDVERLEAEVGYYHFELFQVKGFDGFEKPKIQVNACAGWIQDATQRLFVLGQRMPYSLAVNRFLQPGLEFDASQIDAE